MSDEGIAAAGPDPRRQQRIDSLAKARSAMKDKREAKKRDAALRTEEHAAAPRIAPAERADNARDDWSLIPEDQLTRRHRDERDNGALDIPTDYRKPGWDYEWKSVRCFGEPTDPADVRIWWDQGWRPVRVADMPQMALPGSPPDQPIESKGCQLFARPLRLTIEAKNEDYMAANRQMQDKITQASMGDVKEGIPLVRGVRRVPVDIQMEGLAGSGTGRGHR